ncbi:PREDICTED: uncharacterized protein LOC107344782 [Acropora digitifera]|uniref:uncharacterized protein LOC107344782 n=1 Tax=Acropora digitifera TaxID=70779 RepID=UPI00077ACCB1|nr:PREDICTED: uncharacterized protein LOC107344782 [Acropora digitifera]
MRHCSAKKLSLYRICPCQSLAIRPWWWTSSKNFVVSWRSSHVLMQLSTSVEPTSIKNEYCFRECKYAVMTAKWFAARSCFDICKDGSRFGILHLGDQSAHQWMMNAEYLSGRVQTGDLGAGIPNQQFVGD